MSHSVEILPAAQRQLDKLAKKNRKDTKTIYEAIYDLELEPFPPGLEPIQGSDDLYRVRVGNFRVVYGVDGDTVSVGIVRVGDRKDVYDADPKALQRAFEAWRKARAKPKR